MKIEMRHPDIAPNLRVYMDWDIFDCEILKDPDKPKISEIRLKFGKKVLFVVDTTRKLPILETCAPCECLFSVFSGKIARRAGIILELDMKVSLMFGQGVIEIANSTTWLKWKVEKGTLESSIC